MSHNPSRRSYAVSFLGTLAPFLRASESPIAIACFRLFTVPPLPPLPDFSVPFFSRRTALSTLLPAAFPYFAIQASSFSFSCECLLPHNRRRRPRPHRFFRNLGRTSLP